jgi:hypothetical protein
MVRVRGLGGKERLGEMAQEPTKPEIHASYVVCPLATMHVFTIQEKVAVRDMFEHDSGWTFDGDDDFEVDSDPDPEESPCSSTPPPPPSDAWEESAGVSQSQCPPSQPELQQSQDETTFVPRTDDDAARVQRRQCESNNAPPPPKRVLLMKAMNKCGEKEWSGKGGLDKEATDFMEDDAINNNQ